MARATALAIVAMKYLKWLVAVCLLVVVAPSCSESDTNKVRFVIDSNTPESPIRVYGAHHVDAGYHKRSFREYGRNG